MFWVGSSAELRDIQEFQEKSCFEKNVAAGSPEGKRSQQ